MSALSAYAFHIAVQRVREMRSIAVAFSCAVTVAVVSIQALWLYGGYISASTVDEIIGEFFRNEHYSALVLHWNTLTGGYVVLCSLITIGSYVVEDESLLWLMFWVAVSVPGLLLILGVLLVVVAALIIGTILVALFGGHYFWQSPAFGTYMGYLAFVVVQSAACFGAVYAPRLVRWTWQRQPTTATNT